VPVTAREATSGDPDVPSRPLVPKPLDLP